MLAGSGDRSYVGYLRRFSQQDSKISLVEAVPFERAFRTLANRFRTRSFPEIFKATKLATASPDRQSNTYATVLGQRPITATANTITRPDVPVARSSHNHGSGSRRAIKYNTHNQRIDGALPAAERGLIQHLQSIEHEEDKPCARYNLTYCSFGNTCKFDHRQVYDTPMKRAIERLARMLPCPKGTGCDDGDCVKGHCCPYDGNCSGNCRFRADMHNVDQSSSTTI